VSPFGIVTLPDQGARSSASALTPANDSHAPNTALAAGCAPLYTSVSTGNLEPIVLIKEVLYALKDFHLVKDNVQRYYTHETSSNIPRPLILPPLNDLVSLIGQSTLPDNDDLAHRIWTTMRQKIKITADMTPSEFLSLHTGSNIRLEYLGFMFAIAGRTFLATCKQCGTGEHFAQSMVRCYEICWRLCRQLTITGDAMSWLALERTLTATNYHGDRSMLHKTQKGETS
jgi:hypothetical protein